MDSISISQRYQYAKKVQGGEMSVDEVVKAAKRSPNSVYEWIKEIDNLGRLVEAGYGSAMSIHYIPEARQIQRNTSTTRKMICAERKPRQLPPDVANVMDWLRSCSRRSITTTQLISVMDDIQGFKTKTIQTKRKSALRKVRDCSLDDRMVGSSNDLTHRNTWNEVSAPNIEPIGVGLTPDVEAQEVPVILAATAPVAKEIADVQLSGNSEDGVAQAMSLIIAVSNNVYDVGVIAAGRSLCGRPRIRPNRPCESSRARMYASMSFVPIRATRVNCVETKVSTMQRVKHQWKFLRADLRAASGLFPGTFVVEYVGEVIDDIEYESRLSAMIKDGATSFYFMELSSKRFVDATKFGNLARFINHSCDPNARFEVWNKDGEKRAAITDIQEIDEEITIDYNWWDSAIDFKCMCRTSACKKPAS
ncbi:hypothetical protein AeMF1_020399 [Aphanomyces euteiches]|nr:hypothetical protein AeMF1_020399 [Aphanomyces euteiches]